MGQQPSNKRAGTTLSATQIDASRRTNAHRRSESMKDFMHCVKKISFIAMLVTIPVLYMAFLLLNWHDTNTRNTWITQGISAAIAFVLGKADFSSSIKERAE